MKKQITPFLIFCGLMIFVACGSEQNTTEITSSNETTTTDVISVEEPNLDTTTLASTDSVENAGQPDETTTTTDEVADATTTASTNNNSSTTTTNSTKTPTPTTKTTTTTTNNTTTTTTTATKVVDKPIAIPPSTTKTASSNGSTKPELPPLSHTIFDGLLRKYVNSAGRVNYAGFKNDKAKLVAYLDILKNNPPQSGWSKNKEMAFWINLYNAFTIKVILDKYPVKSIMDLNGGKVWDVQKVTIGSKSYTLGQIEADKLLKRFKEPRVHFAVNCAAASCPPLLNKAWTEDNIQRYYEKQAKLFVNHSGYNTLSAKSLQLSQIFNWYASDFGGASNIVKYVQKYSDTPIKDKAKVSYREYDWKLNKQ
ncbi:MAG: DUF547 domain-containing protein [Aureispira sp.]|nr:DUF547 domain-containing protein [Aureispira sp.]